MPTKTPGATPPADGEPTSERVRGIFSNIAGTYDLINALSSFGLDRYWRRVTVRMAALTPSGRALDLCAGTGDLTMALARSGKPAEVVGTDFVPEMLEVARAKAESYAGPTKITLSVADAQDLPFPGDSFDVVTVAFGVRNLPDRTANFAEVRRVLRPGGKYLILEFSRPTFAPFRALYYWYLGFVVPTLGGLIAKDRASYQYLNDSIKAFPDQSALATELKAAGFTHVAWRNLSGGIVAVHEAIK